MTKEQYEDALDTQERINHVTNVINALSSYELDEPNFFAIYDRGDRVASITNEEMLRIISSLNELKASLEVHFDRI